MHTIIFRVHKLTKVLFEEFLLVQKASYLKSSLCLFSAFNSFQEAVELISCVEFCCLV
jgi:hypothetical protein